MPLQIALPEPSQEMASYVDAPDVRTWECLDLPLVVRRTVDRLDLRSPIAIDLIHGGYLHQLVDRGIEAELEKTGPTQIDGAAQAVLSKLRSGATPDVTWVLTVAGTMSDSAETLMISYPEGDSTRCEQVAVSIIKSATFLRRNEPRNGLH